MIDTFNTMLGISDAEAHHFIKGVEHSEAVIGVGAVLFLAVINYFAYRHFFKR